MEINARCRDYINGPDWHRIPCMPISAVYTVKGGTLAQYDQVIEGLAKLPSPPGGLAHIAATTNDGFIVCDIWDSPSSLEGFATIIAPLIEAAGLSALVAPPVVGPIANLVAGESVNQLPSVAIIFKFPGMTVEKYRDVVKQVPFNTVPATARRAHIATQTPEGMLILAVWDSEATFRQFEPALRQALSANGVEAPAPVIANVYKIAFSPDAARSFAPA